MIKIDNVEPVGNPDELKPCPFCGGEAYTAIKAKKGCVSYEIHFIVACKMCGIELDSAVENCVNFDAVQNAIENVIRDWNKRPNGD